MAITPKGTRHLTAQQKENLVRTIAEDYNKPGVTVANIAEQYSVRGSVVRGIVYKLRKAGFDLPKANGGGYVQSAIQKIKAERLNGN